ncbi:MAG: ABC transporter substrate-binding protein [Anaerolineae bacterium]|nr:ABC transporter substrate-binding protein [Anaerolineae bacterium]
MNRKNFVLMLAAASMLISACGGASASKDPQASLEAIRLPMGYIQNIQYAPYYVAAEKGYYAQAGYEVAFDYRFETDGVALVGSNELPFALVSGEQVLLARAQELPVVYVMTWFQDYPITLISKKGSGIESPADLAGRQIGLPGLWGASYIGLRAVLDQGGVAEEDVVLNSINFTQAAALAAGEEEVVVGYINNEPVQLRSQGVEVDLLPVADYVELAANGVLTNETMIQDHPERVRAFVQATLRGLADTIANPDEAYEISKKYVEGLADADEAVQKEVLALSIELWKADPLGFANPQAWANMQAVLMDMGLLTTELDINAAFTNQFVE